MTVAVREARRRAIRQVYESTGKIGRIVECRFVAVPIAEAGTPSATPGATSAPSTSGAVRILAISVGAGNAQAGNHYTPKSIESLAPMLNGAKAFYDHETPYEMQQRPERAVDDLAGWLSDASVQTVDGRPGVVCMFHPRVGDARIAGLLATAREQAQRYPDADPFVAWSVNGHAVGTVGKSPEDGSKTNIIEAFTDLASIDVVTMAGARGKTLWAASGPRESGRARESSAPSYLRGAVPTTAAIEPAWIRESLPSVFVRERASRPATMAAPSYLRA